MSCAPAFVLAQSWVHLSTTNGDLAVPNAGSEQTDALVFDVDQDGLKDFVIAERTATPSVVWYRRSASGWQRHVIDATQLSIDAGGAHYDVDGDGDQDVILGSDYTDTRIWWFENPAPVFQPGTPWVRHTIKVAGVPMHHDLELGDFDGDGMVEIAYWNQGPNGNLPLNYLFVAQAPLDPRSATVWPATLIFQGAGPSEGMTVIDVDLDGVDDFVGGGYWFKHTAGNSYAAHPVAPSRAFTTVAAGQLIPGGRPEIVFSSGDSISPLTYHRWQPATNTWSQHSLLNGINVVRGHSVAVVDMNGDGHNDIFVGEMRLGGLNVGAKTRILYGDSTGNFTEVVVATGIGMHESKVADLDGDGDLDILGKPYNWQAPRLDIFLQGGTGVPVLPLNSWERHLIDAQLPWQAVLIEAGDVDGDGRKDLLAGGWWWRNPGPLDQPWSRQSFGSTLRNLARAYDHDGDGDLDVLCTHGMVPIPFSPADQGDQFSWGRNNGTGQFTVLSAGSAGVGGAAFLQGVASGVFSPGGPMLTVLSWQGGESGGSGVQWMHPVPGQPTSPWQFGLVHPGSLGEGLSAGDIDGDGDLDVFQGTKWLRNNGGGVFTQFVASNALGVHGQPDRCLLADIDGDGDLDAVVGFAHYVGPSTSLIWLEQPQIPTALWTPRTIATGISGGYSLDVADLDHDGDPDVVLGEHLPPTRLIIYENREAGQTWVPVVVDTGGPGIDHHLGSRVTDLDGDGDLDIYSVGWTHDKVWVFENLAISGNGPGNPAPPPAPPGGLGPNLVTNGGFEAGTNGWSFFSNGVASLQASPVASAGTKGAKVSIATQGTNVQLYQTGIALVAGQNYRLSFRAHSNTGHDLKVFLHKHTAPFTSYGVNAVTFNLTSAWTLFSMDFVAPVTAGDGRLRFWLADHDAAGDQYFIDEVSIAQVGAGTPPPSGPTIVTTSIPSVMAGSAYLATLQAAGGTAPFAWSVTQSSELPPGIDLGAASGVLSGTSMVPGAYCFTVRVCNAAGQCDTQQLCMAVMDDESVEGGANLITNGGFESGTQGWTFYTNGAGSLIAGPVASVGAKAAKIHIVTQGTNVQLYQLGIGVVAGQSYRLSFRAFSNSGRDLSVFLHKHSPPNNSYGLNNRLFNLTPQWATYAVDFTATVTANDARLRFWLAPYDVSGDQYFIDEVVLSPLP